MELADVNNCLSRIRQIRMGGGRSTFMTYFHCDYICEVGVQAGANFKKMTAHNPKLAVVVDCWKDDSVISRNTSHYSQKDLDLQYEILKKEMADKPSVKICRGYSFEVVNQFPDNYFDLVYMDADHTYPGISRDLADWYPKVKSGRFLCGHDYRNKPQMVGPVQIQFEVQKALNEFIAKNNLSTLFFLPPNGWGLIKP